MAIQMDEAVDALRALVREARETYDDYCEDVWGPRTGLRSAVARAEKALGVAQCDDCAGTGGGGRYVCCQTCEGTGYARPAR